MIEILVFSIKSVCIFILLFPFYIFFIYILQKSKICDLDLFIKNKITTCLSACKVKRHVQLLETEGLSLQVKSITKEKEV